MNQLRVRTQFKYWIDVKTNYSNSSRMSPSIFVQSNIQLNNCDFSFASKTFLPYQPNAKSSSHRITRKRIPTQLPSKIRKVKILYHTFPVYGKPGEKRWRATRTLMAVFNCSVLSSKGNDTLHVFSRPFFAIKYQHRASLVSIVPPPQKKEKRNNPHPQLSTKLNGQCTNAVPFIPSIYHERFT